MRSGRSRRSPGGLGRPEWVSRVLALGFFLGASVAVASRASTPFEHGWWLVAYLALVGCLSQLLLATGAAWLASQAGNLSPPRRWRWWALGLWNVGTLAVPAGVFIGSAAAILAGSAVLLAALALYIVALRGVASTAHRRVTRWGYAYHTLVAFLAGSVLVGAKLAEALPWQ